jgi:MFS family permease
MMRWTARRLRSVAIDISPLRNSPAYRRLWFGDVFATFGRNLLQVAVPVQVYGLTKSSLMVGLVSLGQLVPLIAGSLVGGVVVDAVDRRRVILVTQTLLAGVGAGFALNAGLPEPRLWPIFLLAMLQSVVSGFDSPARRAALPNVVGLRQLPAALALQQILSNTSKLGGPALAGVLIAGFGLTPAYWIYVATLGGGLITVYGLPPLRPDGGGRKAGWSSLREGLGYVRKQRMVRSIFLVDINAMVFGLPRALFPAIGITVLGGTAATVGLLYAAPGAGALVGALTSGWVGRVRRQGRGVLIAVLLWGIAMVGFGLSRSIVLALAFLMLAGASDMVSAVLRNTMLQLSTPDALRGRVSSVNKAVVSGGPLLGDAEAGAVAAVTTPTIAVVSGGLACIVGLGFIAWRFPGLARAVAEEGELRIPVDEAPPSETRAQSTAAKELRP